ncbi:MAG: DNA polymerase III subunit gamma/tau, partial [Nocardioidaceae bacterium]
GQSAVTSAAAPPSPADGAAAGQPSAPAGVAGLGLVDVRQLWPGVLDRVKALRRFTWILLSQSAHVKAVGDRVITIGLVNSGARDSFLRSGADEILRQALIDALGVDWQVEAIIDAPGQTPGQTQPSRTAHVRAAPPPTPPGGTIDERKVDVESAKEALRPTRDGAPGHADADQTDISMVSDDDEVIDDLAVSSHELLARELGAQIIDDIHHDTA